MTWSGEINNLKKYNKIAIWLSTKLGDNTSEDFVNFFKETFNGTRIKFLEEYYHNDENDTIDIIFSVYDDDIEKLDINNIPFGILWFDDVLEKMDGYLSIDIIKKYAKNLRKRKK